MTLIFLQVGSSVIFFAIKNLIYSESLDMKGVPGVIQFESKGLSGMGAPKKKKIDNFG